MPPCVDRGQSQTTAGAGGGGVKWGISGVIAGRAIYEGRLDFAAAQKLADGAPVKPES